MFSQIDTTGLNLLINMTFKKRKIFKTAITLALTLGSVVYALSQDYINKIIPPTPTTAALGKYGEVPVSMHTGLPNITVPLAHLSGKDLSVPIELSYHAGGIKVEETSSWVGLGWSLFAGGVITRQPRGLPDDETYGYFFNTIKNSEFINEATGLPTQPSLINASLNGQADFEPDIFYFNFAGESGKFFYNGETSKFVCVTNSRKKIAYDPVSAGFTITSEDGTRYYFLDRELNANAAPCQGSSSNSVTGWYLSKIVNANKTDSILFKYVSYAYSFETLSTSEKKFIANAQADCAAMEFGPNAANCNRQNAFSAKRLKTIIARSGKAVFTAEATSRWDILGDSALQYVEIYNYNNELTQKYRLNHDYFGPPSAGSPSYLYRLRLSSVEKISGAAIESYRNFEYAPHAVPSRLSYAQDYWGYYNGASNADLVPTITLSWPIVNVPITIAGSNRNPSSTPLYSQMGMLTKMIYPTGGYTLFEYENHKVKDFFFAPAAVDSTVQIWKNFEAGTVFQKSFTINYGPTPFNGFNDTGGAFVDFRIDGITCDYGQTSGQASTGCAVITLSGPVGFTLTGNLSNRFLPNGTYTFTFDFSSNTGNAATWQDFYGSASWKVVDSTNVNKSTTGGLRIKKMTDFDPATSAPAYQRFYKYYIEGDTTTSSAEFNALPSFVRPTWYRKEVPCEADPCSYIYTCRTFRLSANCTYPVTGSNGSVTYGFVTVTEDAQGAQGRTTYKYTNLPNPINAQYPYTPVPDYDWKRGMLLEQKDYRYYNGAYQLVKQVTNTYKDIGGSSSMGIKIVPSKVGEEIVYLNGNSDYYGQGEYSINFYSISYSLYTSPDSSIVKTFVPENSSLVNQVIDIKTINPQTLNLTKQQTSQSDGSTVVKYMKYVEDYTNQGTDVPSLAIAQMKTKNMVNTLVEESTWRKTSATDSLLISSNLVLYKIDNGKIEKDKQLSLPVTSSFTASNIGSNKFNYNTNYECELNIIKYDALGNIQQAIGRDSVMVSFLWGSNGMNPVAVVKGAASNDIFYTGFEDATSNVSTTAMTGAKSFTASYTVALPGTGTYKLTYWNKVGSNPWTLVETNISAATTIGGSGTLIDEVRVHPLQAQMTTYTYRPEIGISSVNDPNNSIAFYEYDAFNRLKIIKDTQGNILKNYQYHYKQAASN